MLKESVQILSTALHVTGGPVNEHVYKPFQPHCSCVKWVCKSFEHYSWLFLLALNLQNEHLIRKGKLHKSGNRLGCLPRPQKIPDEKYWCDPPKIMKGYDFLKGYDFPGDTVEAYRNYYKQDKSRFATWKNGAPEWW
jgi:hypothetical protein